jgi:hypothetical protein
MIARYLLCLVALPVAAFAQIVSPSPEEVEVTIYRARPGLTTQVANMDEAASGLAMITETRTIDIPAGLSIIHFRGVAETIVSQSAKLESLPGVIVETNFDYSLIGPGELIAKSIGKSVSVVRTDTSTGRVTEQRATLLSGPEGVLLSIDGRVEALNCSGATERLVFDDVPSALTSEPTLSATVRATEGGRYRVRLSYLATGLDWSADYVARIHPDGRMLDLSGWITLVNKQSTSFPNAQVHVIAGNVSVIEEETRPREIEAVTVAERCWPIGSFSTPMISDLLARNRGMMESDKFSMMAPQAAAMEVVVTAQKRMAEQSELGDYKLFTLPVSTTVAAQQIKQVQMIDQRNVPFERVYVYVVRPEEIDNDSISTKPISTLRLQNKKSSGLGIALPAGTTSAMETARDRLILTGEQTLKDLPVGLPVDIELGEAMNIGVQPRVVREYTRGLSGKLERMEIEIDISNDKPAPIQLELFQNKEEAQDFRIVSESKRHTLKYGMPMWMLKLRAGERMVLRYTLEHADPTADIR